jgi:hypothetical protein
MDNADQIKEPHFKGEWIGIIDKNGVKVCEGSILKDKTGIGHVIYLMEDGRFVISGEDKERGSVFYPIDCDGQLKETEVVGDYHKWEDRLKFDSKGFFDKEE